MAKNWKTFLKIAEYRIKKGDFDGAIRVCDRIINSPENAIPKEIRVEAFIVRGTAYVKKGDIDRALNDSDKVIELDPGNVTALHNRAVAYGHLGAKASEQKFREEYEQELQKIREQSKQDAHKSRAQLQQVREQSEQDAQKSRAQLQQVREQSEQDAQKSRAQLQQVREQSEQDAQTLREQLRKVSEPAEIIAKYEEREHKYKMRINELAGEIKFFANELRSRLSAGFAVIAVVWFIFVFLTKSPSFTPSFTHGFALTSLILAWLAANYPAISRLGDLRKEKRKMEICAEDYFRKLTLVLYTLTSEGDERKKMMAVTHAHFATRSTAEFLAEWNPANEDKSNPLLDAIERILHRKNDDPPSKTPEVK